MFIWKLDEKNPEVYQLPKGMYFIGDLSYLLFDVSEEGDGIKNNEIFSKDLLEDLGKKIEFYSFYLKYDSTHLINYQY